MKWHATLLCFVWEKKVHTFSSVNWEPSIRYSLYSYNAVWLSKQIKILGPFSSAGYFSYCLPWALYTGHCLNMGCTSWPMSPFRPRLSWATPPWRAVPNIQTPFSILSIWTRNNAWRCRAAPRGLMGWNQLYRSLDQLLINLLAGMVSSVLSQFDYVFMLLRTLFFKAMVYNLEIWLA
jgi:hypothetical protein